MHYRRIRRRAHQVLEKARPGDTASSACDTFILSLIALNILVIMLETVPHLHQRFGRVFEIFELVSVIIFSIEYVLRLWVSVESEFRGSPLRKRLRYAFSITALIDLAAILPFYLAILPIDMRFLRAVRLMRIFRVFKIGRYSNSIGTMVRVFRKKRDDLLVTLAVILILLIVVATTMFHIENAAQPDVFTNIFQAMWWGIVTVTGVGYGDMYPVTLAGKVLGGLIALLGIVTIALPIGILGAAYVEDLENKQKGRIRVIRTAGHTIICGVNENTKSVVQDLMEENPESKNVVVTLGPNPEIPGAVYVNADWSEIDVLKHLNIDQAAACMIIAEDFDGYSRESDSDIIDMRTMFTLYKIKLNYPGIHTVAEVINPDKLRMLKSNIRADEIILKNVIDGNLAAHCIRTPRVSLMIYEMISLEGKVLAETSLGRLDLPDKATYAEVVRRGIDTDTTFLGYIRAADNRSELSPANDTVIRNMDRLIYMTDRHGVQR